MNQIQYAGDDKPDGQNVESGAGDAQGRPLESVRIAFGITLQPMDHVPHTDAGDNFYERIQPKAEEAERIVVCPEINRNNAFQNIIENRHYG